MVEEKNIENEIIQKHENQLKLDALSARCSRCKEDKFSQHGFRKPNDQYQSRNKKL